MIRFIANRTDADALIAFVLGPDMFATPLTPGEEEIIRTDPISSLHNPLSAYWLCESDEGTMQGALGIRSHINRTGIYEMTCIAVSPSHRGSGIGKLLIEHALLHIQNIGGRGMLVDTSDHPSYAVMRSLLTRCGFAPIGLLPEFYYPGEGALLYYRILTPKGDK